VVVLCDYVPVVAIENGLGETVVSNAMLFLTPFMLKWIERKAVRGVAFFPGGIRHTVPWERIALLIIDMTFLVLLDIVAGLSFLMSVKPPERGEMLAVYSSFRDVSGLLSPGAACSR
jgi:ACDE family multidrug resistance protein